MTSIRLIDIGKQFGAVCALEAVNLDVQAGEFIVLLGASGSGKSTLLNLVAGIETPTRGRILLGDTDVAGLEPSKRNVSMVFQSCYLYPSMSVEQNLSFTLQARKWRRQRIRSRIDSVATLLGIESLLDRVPAQLSGGQRQRVAIGRALVSEPAVVLLDEPFSSLDPPLRAKLRGELRQLHERTRSTFIHVTHDAAEAMTLANRIAVLERGTVVQFDTPRNVYRRPATVFTASLIGSPPINLIRAQCSADEGSIVVQLGHRFMRIPRLAAAPCGCSTVIAGIRPEDVRLMPPAQADTFEAEITAIDCAGADNYSRLVLHGQDIVARMSPDMPVTRGSRVTFAIEPAAVSFFCPVDGRRLNV